MFFFSELRTMASVFQFESLLQNYMSYTAKVLSWFPTSVRVKVPLFWDNVNLPCMLLLRWHTVGRGSCLCFVTQINTFEILVSHSCGILSWLFLTRNELYGKWTIRREFDSFSHPFWTDSLETVIGFAQQECYSNSFQIAFISCKKESWKYPTSMKTAGKPCIVPKQSFRKDRISLR